MSASWWCVSPTSAGEAVTVTLIKSDAKVVFERAYFGFNGMPATSLHVELHRGGDEGCPHPGSATPLQTLVLSNVPLATEKNAASAADGVTASLIDFAQAFTSSLAPLSAHNIALTSLAASRQPPRSIAFGVQLAFDGGLVASGQVYATHCASLDS